MRNPAACLGTHLFELFLNALDFLWVERASAETGFFSPEDVVANEGSDGVKVPLLETGVVYRYRQI
jgi:hypothetical protein